jgi:Protein of unknown function (DUF541)
MHTFRRSAALLALTVGSVASLPALAADELHYNQISLRAEVSQEVARDQMIVTLYTEEQNTDPAKLAAAISTTMNKATAQAKQVKDITLRTGSRNSYPIYDTKGQKITGWRERAELRLESTDFAALSKLTGELLTDLQGQRRPTAQRSRHRLQDPRPTGHRRPGRQGLQNRQPEPQQQRLPTTVPARADDDESRGHGFGAGNPGSRSRHQSGRHDR